MRVSSLINVALGIAVCFQAALVANQMIGHSLARAAGAVSQRGPAEPALAGFASAPEWAERQPILDRNLFQAATLADPPPAPAPVEEVAETELPLRLRGTLSTGGDVPPRVAIYDTERRASQVLRRGDQLEGRPNVEIARIERGRVLLLNEGEHEELVFGEAPRAAPRRPTRSLAQNPEYRARLKQIRRQVRRGEIDRRDMAGLVQDLRREMQ